jgi:hypothetical protein
MGGMTRSHECLSERFVVWANGRIGILAAIVVGSRARQEPLFPSSQDL